MLPVDYENRVYAAWLGKCIGVRFGAPLENWTYEEIRDNLGDLQWYVREDRGKIFKPDDDTSVPLIQLRAIQDYDSRSHLTAQECAETLLNYIGDHHGTFWWGGYGISSEETAYMNLISGIPAPLSGSIAMNGEILPEQIGGQIFSDIWGLVAPNQPALAADLAGTMASVSHDRNGIYGGRFIAALTAAAFSESDPRKLIEIGLEHIPSDSQYTEVVRAMLDFHAQHPEDWHAAFAHLKAHYGDHLYPGLVHIIPNAGVVILGLLYGEGDFSQTLRITNMAGWDTDCNVGNVGAIMGAAVGLEAIDYQWREPMNDLVVLASLIGTRNIMTIPQCADLICHLGRKLSGEAQSETKARYHFGYSGSTNNFIATGKKGRPIHIQQAIVEGEPSLKVSVRKLNKKGEIRVATRTYYRPSELLSNYYGAAFTPRIYPEQTVTAKLYLPTDAPQDIKAAIFVYDDNHAQSYQAQAITLTPNTWHNLTYTIPPLDDACLSQVGIVLRNVSANWTVGSFAISELDWDNTPHYSTTFAKERPETGAISQWTYLRGYWRLENGAYHGSGIGYSESYSGDIDWTDYTVSSEITPLMGDYHLINVRVQGALRSYAFGLAPDNTIALYKKNTSYQLMQKTDFTWQHGQSYRLKICAKGDEFVATIEGDEETKTIHWRDTNAPYRNGQIGLSIWNNGHTAFHWLKVVPEE
ncbi:MAG: ADP-ribosylglycohydrolase family protein [Anaerolineae bacterium]|nr:ADP-ribosylglycohydrolase family protein [Anaerolineae bacterium]